MNQDLMNYYNSKERIERLEKELKKAKEESEDSFYALCKEIDKLVQWNVEDETKRLSSRLIADDEKIAVEIYCEYGTHKTLSSEMLFKIVEIIGIKDFEIKPINSERFYIVFYK